MGGYLELCITLFSVTGATALVVISDLLFGVLYCTWRRSRIVEVPCQFNKIGLMGPKSLQSESSLTEDEQELLCCALRQFGLGLSSEPSQSVSHIQHLALPNDF